jgi:phage baseplate assembly protein W
MTAVSALGRGWPFPVAPDPDARRLPYVEGPEKVRQAIRVVLDTDPGERVMRPSFGCPLRRFLGAPNSVGVRAEIGREVELALGTWEPRIELKDVSVVPGDDRSLVEIAVAYIHTRTRRPDNLVYVLPLA